MYRPRPVLILTAAFVTLIIASCQNPFGYYVGANNYPLTNLTAETAPAKSVLAPVFYAVPTTGGSPRTVSGAPTEKSDQEVVIHTPTGEATVSAFAIDPASGAISPVTGSLSTSSYATGQTPYGAGVFSSALSAQ